MYSILHFPKDNSVEGVLSSWVKTLDGKLYCQWPNTKGQKNSNMIRNCVAPETTSKYTWSLYPSVLKCTCANYEEMRQKVREAERPTTTDLNTSDSASGSVELSSSENELPTPPKRKTLQKKRVHTDYSEEEAEDLMPPKKKKMCS